MSVIVPIDMPKTCVECPMISKSEEEPLGKGLYKKICKCHIAPEEVKDPYRDLYWLVYNKPEWCPLKEVKGE